MQKEKKIKTYQRRTKSGKMVTVKAHTAKYDAAEKAKEMAKKKGAGDELDYRKKMPDPKLSMNEYLDELKKRSKEMTEEAKEKVAEKEAPKKATKKSTAKETKKAADEKATTKGIKFNFPEPAFTAAEFKEWYRGTGSAADKKVAKALRAQLGRSGYRKFEDEAIDNYSSRGHLSMFKRVSGGGDVKEAKATPKAEPKKAVKAEKSPAKTEVAKPTGKTTRKITADHAKRYAEYEDISVKDARRELAEMSDKEFQRSLKTHSTPSGDSVLRSLRPGSRGIYGSDVKVALEHLKSSGSYTPVKVKGVGTLYTDGRTGYVYKSGGMGPAQIRKASKDELSAAKTEKSPAKVEAAKAKSMKAKVESYASKHGLTYEEDGVYSNRKGENFTLGVKGGKVVKRKVNDHLTADSKAKAKPTSKPETPEQLRKRADKMESSQRTATKAASVKTLSSEGYQKYTYQGTTFYHKGKEGSYGGSYKVIDKDGNIKSPMPYLKEHFKAKIAKNAGKTYKPRKLK